MVGDLAAASVFDLAGAAALVTGASSGLGTRFAEVLAANGARVALAGRNREALDRLESEIKARGGKAMSVAFDVREREKIPQAFDAVEAALGPVSVVVNNAGIAGSIPLADLSYEGWREILDVDLDGLFLIAREAALRMKDGGTIINVASILGFRALAGTAAYSAAKAAVIQLSAVFAAELAPRRIRVNTLAPGYVVTGMNRAFFASEASRPLVQSIPLGRVGAVDDFDGAILFLASRASRFMTGTVLVVDGGHTVVL